MQIQGLGIDLVEIPRIQRLIDRHGRRFLERCYTSHELGYFADHRRVTEHLAGRFAAKEAILKVLGTGLARGIQWADVEVRREPSGQPTVALHGQAQTVADELGIRQWFVSITHTGDHAMAAAVGCG